MMCVGFVVPRDILVLHYYHVCHWSGKSQGNSRSEKKSKNIVKSQGKILKNMKSQGKVTYFLQPVSSVFLHVSDDVACTSFFGCDR